MAETSQVLARLCHVIARSVLARQLWYAWPLTVRRLPGRIDDALRAQLRCRGLATNVLEVAPLMCWRPRNGVDTIATKVCVQVGPVTVGHVSAECRSNVVYKDVVHGLNARDVYWEDPPAIHWRRAPHPVDVMQIPERQLASRHRPHPGDRHRRRDRRRARDGRRLIRRSTTVQSDVRRPESTDHVARLRGCGVSARVASVPRQIYVSADRPHPQRPSRRRSIRMNVVRGQPP